MTNGIGSNDGAVPDGGCTCVRHHHIELSYDGKPQRWGCPKPTGPKHPDPPMSPTRAPGGYLTKGAGHSAPSLLLLLGSFAFARSIDRYLPAETATGPALNKDGVKDCSLSKASSKMTEPQNVIDTFSVRDFIGAI
jgi:hypothetical protein